MQRHPCPRSHTHRAGLPCTRHWEAPGRQEVEGEKGKHGKERARQGEQFSVGCFWWTVVLVAQYLALGGQDRRNLPLKYKSQGGEVEAGGKAPTLFPDVVMGQFIMTLGGLSIFPRIRPDYI